MQIFSRLIDFMKRRMKLALVLLLGLSATCFAWLAALCLHVLPFSKWQLYAATIGKRRMKLDKVFEIHCHLASIAL